MYECRICLIEELIAVLPWEVTEDNVEKVWAQLNEILDFYRELTAEEQEQIDISHCLKLQKELEILMSNEGESMPFLIADAVSYRICDAYGKNWTIESCETYTEISPDTAGSSWDSGWYVVTGDVTIGSRVTVSGDVYLILTDGCLLDTGGITVESGSSLTIYAQSNGADRGSLRASASGDAAGIGGGGKGKNGGTITIYGGDVVAVGGVSGSFGGAGIGGGASAFGGTVTIHGGRVEATASGNFAPGIGGVSGGTICITGGTVTAKGYNSSDRYTTGGDLTITGGTLNGKAYYMITFITDDAAVNIPIQGIAKGEKAVRPGEPNGYMLSFFTDASYTEPYDFNQPVGEDITLYVRCEENTNYIVSVTIDGAETKYTSTKSFVNVIENLTGGTEASARLLQDVDMGAPASYIPNLTVPGGVTLTLDCGQWTLSGAGAVTIAVNGTFNFMGGTLLNTSAQGIAVYAQGNGKFNMSGGLADRTGGGDNYAVQVVSGAKITVTDGTIGVKGKGLSITSDSTAVISGGTYSSIWAPNKTIGDILADGCALQYTESKEFIPRDTSGQLSNVTVTKECTHAGAVTDKGDGTHGASTEDGVCPYCGISLEPKAHTPDGDNMCTGCGIYLVAQAEIEGSGPLYYGAVEDALAMAKGKKAVVTLRDNVEDVPRLEVSDGDITFNGGEYSLTSASTDSGAFHVSGGRLTITGGIIKATADGTAGVVIDSGSLVVTGGTFEGTGSTGYGLKVNGDNVLLGGGTFTGGSSAIYLAGGKVSDILQDYGTENEPHYAYYQDGNAVTSGLDEAALPGGSYMVAQCQHMSTELETRGDGTHLRKCPACGYIKAEKCTYTWAENSNVGECACGSTIAVALNDADDLIYDGKEKKPVIVTLDGNKELTAGSDYEISYTDNQNAGMAAYTITGMSFQGTFEGTFIIERADVPLSGLDYTLPAGLIYTGESSKVDVTTNLSGVGKISVQYKKDDAEDFLVQAIDPGAYHVYAVISEGQNYKEAEIKLGEFTIEYYKGNVPVKISGKDPATEWYAGNEVKVTANGFTVADGLKGNYDDVYTIKEAGTYTLYFRQTGTNYTTEGISYRVKFDNTPPVGRIALKYKWWERFLSVVSFGHYKAENKTVAITADDSESGISSENIRYFIKEGKEQFATVDELKAAASSRWTVYEASNPPVIKANTPTAVYAMLTDKVGNVTYIGTEGILMDGTAPIISDFEVVKDSVTDSVAQVSLKVDEAATVYFVAVPASDKKDNYRAEDIIATCNTSAIGGRGWKYH